MSYRENRQAVATMKTTHPFRNILLLASMLLMVAGSLVAQTPLLRLSAEFQSTSSVGGEVSTNLPPPGIVAYQKTIPIPPDVDVLYVTFSAQADTHNGSALLMEAFVNGVRIQPLAGSGIGGGGTIPGWYTLLKLPAPTTSTNCNPVPLFPGDGGGGTADCHDNNIFFSGCYRVQPTDRPNATVTIRLANSPGGVDTDNTSFYERATIYIDGQTDGSHLCNGVSTAPH